MTALVVVRSHAGIELALAARRAAGSTAPAVLVGYSDATIPELAPSVLADGLPDGFGSAVDLNAELAPQHPDQWQPADSELPLLRRLLGERWASGPVTELWVENLDHVPATTLARVFDDAEIHLIGAGLLAYGPPSVRRPQQLQQRIARLWHRDLVPGLAPATTLPVTALPATVLPAPADREGAPALVLGADLGGSGLAATVLEVELHLQLVRRAAEASGTVLFSPHPAMPPARRWLVERAAAQARLAVQVVEGRVDGLVAGHRPVLVVGFGSAALLRPGAAGYPVACVGAVELLAGMTPYHHAARIPLTIADAVLRTDRPYRGEELQRLLEAVAFVVRPQELPDARDRAAAFMAGLPAGEWRRYFRRHRAERLGLPVRA